MTDTKQTSRELLSAIGVGQHNATQIIPYVLIAPAVIDPKAPQSILLLRHLQRVLYQMGATDVVDSGYVDPPTARALRLITGPNWERQDWATNISAVLRARDRGQRLDAVVAQQQAPGAQGMPVAVSGPLDFLPDVPGGLVTYGVVAFLVYRHFTKRRTR